MANSEAFQEFEGFDQNTDIPTAMAILEYLRASNRLEYSDLQKRMPETKKTFMANKRRMPIGTWSSIECKAFTRELFRAYTRKVDGKFQYINFTDSFQRNVILPFFAKPLKKYFDLAIPPREDAGVLASVENPSDASIEDLYDKFKRGAFIYRYSKNEGDNKRLAKGHLEMTRNDYDGFLRFNLNYDPDWEEHSKVSGNVYLINSFAFLVGVNKGSYPFFMLFNHTKSNNRRIGALVFRKHKNGYLTSRSMVRWIGKDELHLMPNGDIANYIGQPSLEEAIDHVGEQERDKLRNLSDYDISTLEKLITAINDEETIKSISPQDRKKLVDLVGKKFGQSTIMLTCFSDWQRCAFGLNGFNL